MEFEQYKVRCLESSEEEEKEVVSLRYFLTENAGLSLKPEKSTTNHHDALFEFAPSNSTACKFCPAEDEMFRQDWIFPQQISSSKSKSVQENRRLLHEKLDAWRRDSLGSQSSFVSPNSKNSQKRGFHSSSETVFRRNKTTLQPDRKAKTINLPRKTRLKWLQFFTGGLITIPPLDLQELRLKQAKPKNSVFKRSVSDEGLVTWGKELKVEERSISVKESMRRKESIVSKGLNILRPMIKCLYVRDRGLDEGKRLYVRDRGLDEGKRLYVRDRGLGEGNKIDQNSMNSKKGGARVHPSPLGRPLKRSRWIFPKLLLHLFWP